MDFIRNFPFFCIMLLMFSGIVSSVLNPKASRTLTKIVLILNLIMASVVLWYTWTIGDSVVYYMGHFPAPWGNEIRFGCLEALMAIFFSATVLLAVMGGESTVETDIEPGKQNLFYIIVDLMTASLIAMTYTNDLFTAYVFIEINTIAGCGLIMIRQIGKATITATRYMVNSLLGSGLFLIGVTLLYTVTGHLLMSNIQESVSEISQNSEYTIVLATIIGLMTVGLSIKSGLFPFHTWIPDAYGVSNVTASALLSGTVSKGYIFLLIKIYYRVIGFDLVVDSKIINIIFVCGIAAIIMGSVLAIREKNVRKIIAYSSVAQIGYIYMGIGLGTEAGVIAAIFHIMAHGITKALMFIASSHFTEGSHAKKLEDIRGLAYSHKFSAFMFSCGAFSMIGFPLLSGFISKLLFSQAAVGHRYKMFIALFALAISTILNAVYFLRMVIVLYSTRGKTEVAESGIYKDAAGLPTYEYIISMVLFVALNFFLGMNSQPIINIIEEGLRLFN